MSWSREQCEILIEEFQKHPCLYAVKSPHYKNKHARQSALNAIKTVIVQVKPTITIQDIKVKFSGLKTNFLNEYKKYKTSKHSGAGEDAVYTPSIWYFKKMFFLLEHVQVRKSYDSLSEDSLQTEESNEEISNYVVDSEGILLEDTADENQTSEVQENLKDSNNDADTSSAYTPNATTDAGTSSPYTQIKRVNKRKHTTAAEANLMRDASNALTSISTAIISSSQNNGTEEDESLAKFIISKLKRITDERVRLDVEEDIIHLLYNGVKQCENFT